MSRVERAEQLAALLVAGGVDAVVDPQLVAGRPGVVVLIVAPRLVLAGNREATWQLYAIAPTTVPSLSSWRQLDDVVDQVDELLCCDTAAPASYATTAGVDPSPAYLITYTEGA